MFHWPEVDFWSLFGYIIFLYLIVTFNTFTLIFYCILIFLIKLKRLNSYCCFVEIYQMLNLGHVTFTLLLKPSIKSD